MNRHILANLALIAILLLAALLRMWNLDATEFKYDEATVCNLAARFVDTGIPPVRGMGSSTGIDNPPLTVYLMALPILLSRDPLVATAFVALLNVAGVWACYWLGKQYWGMRVGLLAAALTAVSPWAVFYSRKVWAQDLLPPFAILFVSFLLAWSLERHRWALSGTIVSLAALVQIHMAAVSLIPLLILVVLLTLVVFPSHRPAAYWGKPLIVGIMLSLLLYTPYIVFDALIGWRNARALAEMLKAPAQTYWETARFALLNIGGREIHALAGPARFREFLSSILDLNYWPDRIEEWLAIASAIHLSVRIWRQRRDRRALVRDALLVSWLIIPVLFFLRSSSPVFPHYLIPLYPAPYLVLAIGTTDLLRATIAHPRLRHLTYALVSLSCGILLAWQSYLSISIYAFVEVHDTPNGMGTPIGVLRSIAVKMKHYASAWDNRQTVVLCPGDNPATDECPAVIQFMVGDKLDARFVDSDDSLLFPKSDADTLIVIAPGSSAGRDESLAAREITRYAKELSGEAVWLREATGAYRFYRLPAGYAPLPPVQPDGVPVHLENGVTLHGYELSRLVPGKTALLTLYWQVDNVPTNPPPQGYSFANHLLASNSQRYGQKDGPGYPVPLWRQGDALLSWFEIPVAANAPGGPYYLRVGMYTYIPPDQFVTAHVIDEAGQRVSDAVEWSVQ